MNPYKEALAELYNAYNSHLIEEQETFVQEITSDKYERTKGRLIKAINEAERLLSTPSIQVSEGEDINDVIEKIANDSLADIHKHTTLCDNEHEEHIFLCGVNVGYKEAAALARREWPNESEINKAAVTAYLYNDHKRAFFKEGATWLRNHMEGK